MAAGDEQPPDESDKQSPAPKTPDVRVGSHDDMGVHISRDLSGSGPTARGYNSKMSKLNFSARALPRDETASEEPAPTKPSESALVQPSSTGAPSAAPDAPDANGPLSWLTGLFSRR